jgi:regulator of sirC expression with transglutaminase-like and TPR domain
MAQKRAESGCDTVCYDRGVSIDPGQRLFANVVGRPDAEIELDVAALILGDWEYDHIDVAHYVGVLDELAAAVMIGIDTDESSLPGDHGEIALRALNHTLFDEHGFRGNQDDYYDPRNSFLHEVIDRRVGIPITLSVLYMEVARRVGLTVHGIGFPGHFLVRWDGADGTVVVVDAFRGGLRLDTDDLEAMLQRSAGPSAKLEPAMLVPSSKRQILTRMLTNLAGIYGRSGDVVRSIAILERLHVLDPENERLQRELDRLQKKQLTLN